MVGVPSDVTEEYRYYRATYYSYYIGQGIAAAVGVLVLVNRDLSSPLGKLVGLALCAALAWAFEYDRRVFRERPFSFRVDAAGITGQTLSGRSLRVLWSDVEMITRPSFREIGWRGPSVLLLAKTGPANNLLIGKHLPGYSRLAARIVQMTPGRDHSAL